MLSPALLAIVALSAAQPALATGFVATGGSRAQGRATVRLVSAEVVPMSAESVIGAPQRRTIVRLADGDHDAFLVEFE
ncbi:MAG: hypothetical protein ABIO29_03605 [Sphingomicrobium sp.]